jgi:origin recognition complex subunit 3
VDSPSLISFSLWNGVGWLQVFHAQIRWNIRDALNQPSAHLARSAEEAEEEADKEREDDGFDTDLCRAYHLFKDAGKLVNLADWFHAFEREIDQMKERKKKRRRLNGGGEADDDNEEKEEEEEEEEEDEEDEEEEDESDGEDSVGRKTKRQRQRQRRRVEARFVEAVSELALIGFLQPTKRKTEHVARVVW